ncbi:DUF5753 domain-containing protein [Micromonospora sp. NPDC049523]|uniref:DUF5753 domain-containing protein n=1 Tax=Micromonospora sp. NPDC049523 TaxID=3155921 RepID=UPI00341EFFEE
MLDVGRVLPPETVEQIVASRLKRQWILSRDQPPQFHVVVDEVVLRRLLGNRDLMREQLEHLAKMAELPCVQLRVIPSDTPWHTGLAGSFVLAQLRDGKELAYLDNQLRGQIEKEAADIVMHKKRWDNLTGEALSRRQTIELIRDMAQTWTSPHWPLLLTARPTKLTMKLATGNRPHPVANFMINGVNGLGGAPGVGLFAEF